MLEYYFSKGFVVLECNSNHLNIISDEEKQIIHAMECMIQTMLWLVLPKKNSISNMLKTLLLQYNFHSSYNQTKYIGEEEINK